MYDEIHVFCGKIGHCGAVSGLTKKFVLCKSNTENEPDFFVKVYKENPITPEFCLAIKSELGTNLFNEVLVWNNKVIIAVETVLYIFDPENENNHMYNLSSFFDRFVELQDELYVCTANNISRINSSGQYLWTSEKVSFEHLKIVFKNEKYIDVASDNTDALQGEVISISLASGKIEDKTHNKDKGKRFFRRIFSN